MDNKKLAKFKRLKKSGLTPEQIMEKMGICRATYYNYQKEASINRRKKEIDKQRYFELIRQGYTTKVELAAKLGVSHPTLLDFEKKNQVAQLISKGMYVQGIKMILPDMLHISVPKAKEYTNGLPTITGTVRNLKTIIVTLEQFAEYSPDVNATIRTISKALNLIESIENFAKTQIGIKL